MGPARVHICDQREALQVDGEQILPTGAASLPTGDVVLTAAIARTFPATQLFRRTDAAASGARLDFDDAEATIVWACSARQAGRSALAIDLAARRVEAYGQHQTAALLDHV